MASKFVTDGRTDRQTDKFFDMGYAEIVETTFVVSRFSDIQKEKTLFLVVPKKTTRNDARLVSDLTINDQEGPETNQLN